MTTGASTATVRYFLWLGTNVLGTVSEVKIVAASGNANSALITINDSSNNILYTAAPTGTTATVYTMTEVNGFPATEEILSIQMDTDNSNSVILHSLSILFN